MPPKGNTNKPDSGKKRGRPTKKAQEQRGASDRKTFEELAAADETPPEISDDDLADPRPAKKQQQRAAVAETSSKLRVAPPKLKLISDGAPPFDGHRRAPSATSTPRLKGQVATGPNIAAGPSTPIDNRREPDAATPLPLRSRGPPPALRRPCCLRCSKRIVTDPGYHCDVKPNVRCAYCSKGHKPCDSIPVEFYPRVNRLFDAVDALEDDEVAGPALVKRQKSYTAAVTAHQRVAGREGLKKKPTTGVEVGLLQLAESRRQTRLFEGMLDSFRAVHNLPPLVHDPPEPVVEEDDEESGEEEGEEEP